MFKLLFLVLGLILITSTNVTSNRDVAQPIDFNELINDKNSIYYDCQRKYVGNHIHLINRDGVTILKLLNKTYYE